MAEPVHVSTAVHAQARSEQLRRGAQQYRARRAAPPREAPRAGVRAALAGGLRHLADHLEPRRTPDVRREDVADMPRASA